MLRLTLIHLALLIATSLCASSQAPVTLGVLEDATGAQPSVRVLFQSDGEDWRPLATDCPDYDCSRPFTPQPGREATWTIYFEGRNVGQVKTRIPVEFDTDAALGRQKVITRSSPPAPRLRPAHYGGADEPNFRELVASSTPHAADPDGWKPSAAPSDVSNAVRKAFRAAYPQVHNCATGQPVPYRDTDIAISETYASNFYWHLLEVNLEGCARTQDGSKHLGSQWFAVNGANEAELIGEAIDLVGSGDFDNDGSSELIFSVNRKNRSGYELFYDDFRGHVTLVYSMP